jgi:putative ABC transport system permease protein
MAESEALAAPLRRSQLPLAFSIALRELRAGAERLLIFVICIALGVAAVAAIGSLSASFEEGLANQGRKLVGGDLSFERVHERAKPDERAALEALGTISGSASLRAMARAGGKSALIEVKAVDAAYPLYGDVAIAEPKDAGTLWREPGKIVVERPLLDRLGAHVGDEIAIGEAKLTISGVLGDQPDRLADRLAYGPRVLMSLDTLDRTKLIQPGSLVRWVYRLKLPSGKGDDKRALADTHSEIATQFPQSGFDIRDWTDPAPSIRRDARRFTQFIAFVGLTALLLGGIGIGNAIASYMAKKRSVIAIFKSLGASSNLVLHVYLIQALLLAGLGIGLGLLLGTAAPGLLAARYADILPVDLALEPHLVPLLTAALAGLLTMLLFVLWPLGRASRLAPASLLRAQVSPEDERPAPLFAAGSFAAGFTLFALAILASEERAITGGISTGIVAAFVGFYTFGWALEKLAARLRRTPARQRPALALALASIAAPGSLARAVTVSLGLGLGLLIAVALIDRSLMAEFKKNLQADVPSYYFLDVDGNHLAAFRNTALSVAPGAKLADAPMLRGRITTIKGVPTDKAEVNPDQRWVLAGDRGLTYTDAVPEGSTLVEGEWWPKDYQGPPLVSFDAEAAKGLGLKLGDSVTVNILGRNVEARIASLRKIDWESLAISFVMVFSPNTLAGAPHRALTTVELPKNTSAEQEAKLMQALADKFPLVTAIKVGDIVQAAKDLIAKVMTAIEVTAGVMLAIGAVVLAGAISAGQQRRKYHAVLYKTLGATRRCIVGAELLEFGLLGLATAALAVLAGAVTAWALCRFVFELKFVFSSTAVAETVLLALLLVLGLGAIATWRVLSAKAAPYLRAE